VLASSLRRYIAASSTSSAEDRETSLPYLAAGLARLLGQRLAEQPGWTPWRWIDSILCESASVSPTGECQIWGLAIWADGDSGHWVEPFTATMRLDKADQLSEYLLRFGDARRGLGQVPYGARRGHLVRDYPPEWLYTIAWPAA
jgi:hypothetical protein